MAGEDVYFFYSGALPLAASGRKSSPIKSRARRTAVLGNINWPSVGVTRAAGGAFMHAAEYTVNRTQVATDQHILQSNAIAFAGKPDDIYRGMYVSAVTGSAAETPHARLVVASDGVSGELVLDEPMPDLVVSGDIIRVSQDDNLFPTVSRKGCEVGVVDYRTIFFHNITGVTLDSIQFFVIPVDAPGVRLDIQVMNTNSALDTLGTIPNLRDPESDPLWPEIHEAVANADGKIRRWTDAHWIAADHYAQPNFANAANTSSLNLSNVGYRAVTLRRTVLPGRRRRQRCCFILGAKSTTAGQDPDPFVHCQPIVFDMEGPAYSVAVTFDRTIFEECGSIVEAMVTDSVSGDLIEDVFVTFSLTGPGSISPVGGFTDFRGTVRSIYSADPATAGMTVQIEAAVAEGDPEF